MPKSALFPGKIIRDQLAKKNMSELDFSEAVGLTSVGLLQLLNGQAIINISLARRLAEIIGESVDYWINIDIEYWESKA